MGRHVNLGLSEIPRRHVLNKNRQNKQVATAERLFKHAGFVKEAEQQLPGKQWAEEWPCLNIESCPLSEGKGGVINEDQKRYIETQQRN